MSKNNIEKVTLYSNPSGLSHKILKNVIEKAGFEINHIETARETSSTIYKGKWKTGHRSIYLHFNTEGDGFFGYR